MTTIEEKLKAIDDRFRNPSKQRDAARYIVRKNSKITSDERKAIIETIPIKRKTLQGLFTELRKLNLYPPQKPVDVPKRAPIPEKPQEPSHHTPEDPMPHQIEYATKEDFETLRNSINYLASVISGEAPSNPGELESVIRGEALSNPGESEEEEYREVITPEGMFIQDASLTRASVFLKPKTQMYFDMARQGVFANYAGTREPGPFAQFDGNLSDFFNLIVDDYFVRNYYADIGLTMRRYVK